MAATHPSLHSMAAARGPLARRLALWLAAIVFLVQLLAAGHHDHEIAAKSQHCVACALHAQPHAAPPAIAVGAAPFSWTLLHPPGIAPAEPAAAPAIPYLRPPTHAPPAFPHAA